MSTASVLDVAFDDRNRAARALLALVGLFAIMVWFAFAGPMHEITFANCIAAPEKWDGKELRLSVIRVRGLDEGFILVRAGRTIGRVRPPEGRLPNGLKTGDTVSVEGVFRSTGILEARRVYVHEARAWKNRASLIGMFIAIGAAVIVFRWDRERYGLVERFDDA